MKKNSQKLSIFYRHRAFTLAEVLVTLGIIGVVAALTIPTLMNNIQDYQLKQAWKKEYSVMAQVVARMAQDNGGSIKGLFTSNDTMRDSFKPYLNVAKTCNNLASFGSCWASGFTALNGLSAAVTVGWRNTSGFILNDGASIIFESADGGWVNCDGAIAPQLSICGYAPVDVNGPSKGPNVIGRDIFDFWVLENKILPEGCAQDGRSTCSPAGNGSTCSATYLLN